MDEPPIKDDPEAEEPQAPAEVEEAPQSKTQAPTEEVVFEGLATGKEPWRGGGGCSSRLPLYGCLFGMALLIGAGGGPKPAAESAGGRASAHDREPGTIPRFA